MSHSHTSLWTGSELVPQGYDNSGTSSLFLESVVSSLRGTKQSSTPESIPIYFLDKK